jgi:lipopolysaccharide/colanic/teichoic acid biosynthesis glycosyltransferase
MMQRAFDLLLSVIALCVLAPALLVIAAVVKFTSPGPVFFRQERTGQGGRPFRIHKFRTMVQGAERAGPQVTIAQDPRITGIGRILRRYKLDELPQFIDVMVGDMSLVGPRPEVPRFVAEYPEECRSRILAVRPGLTDPVALEFLDEAELLANSHDAEREYIDRILPIKLEKYLQYIETRSLATDMCVLVRTAWRIVYRR